MLVVSVKMNHEGRIEIALDASSTVEKKFPEFAYRLGNLMGKNVEIVEKPLDEK